VSPRACAHGVNAFVTAKAVFPLMSKPGKLLSFYSGPNIIAGFRERAKEILIGRVPIASLTGESSLGASVVEFGG
jgi:hypothetical protein